MTADLLESLSPELWFLQHITHISADDWTAKAMTVGRNPLVGYTCIGFGRTIEESIEDLLANILSGERLIPPPEPNEPAPIISLDTILKSANLPPEPIIITRRFA